MRESSSQQESSRYDLGRRTRLAVIVGQASRPDTKGRNRHVSPDHILPHHGGSVATARGVLEPSSSLVFLLIVVEIWRECSH